MKRFINFLLTLLAIAILLACTGKDDPDSMATNETPNAEQAASNKLPETRGINWFKGSVDEAFQYAREQNKPIFLYWGAEWCPPCHEIKVTVFDKRAFIERSRLFVPVYLDGDTEKAQELGEKFTVYGYPTMVVFAPDGTEITRIPGGIDIQAYANVLDLTLSNTRPVNELLDMILTGGQQLSVEDCQLMAYYSWGQDKAILAKRNAADVFQAMMAACPMQATVERSILFVNYLDEVIDESEDPEQSMPLEETERQQSLSELNKLLDNYSAAKANIYSIIFNGADYSTALTEPDTEARANLRQKILNNLERMKTDESLFKTERLYTLRGKLRFHRLDNPDADLPVSLRQEILDMVAWADRTTPDPYERQTVVNAASNLLNDAKMYPQAKELLLRSLDKATQPYYFMVTLADLEQEAGNNAAALSWLKRAYDESTGPATRFQWGIYWVTGLIQMTPDDVATISAETLKVFREIEGSKAFYQRPKRQMQSLERKLKEWNTDARRSAGIEEIRLGVRSMCASIPDTEPARPTCEKFLAEEPARG